MDHSQRHQVLTAVVNLRLTKQSGHWTQTPSWPKGIVLRTINVRELNFTSFPNSLTREKATHRSFPRAVHAIYHRQVHGDHDHTSPTNQLMRTQDLRPSQRMRHDKFLAKPGKILGYHRTEKRQRRLEPSLTPGGQRKAQDPSSFKDCEHQIGRGATSK